MADSQEQKTSLAFTFQKKKVVQKVAANLEERKDVGQLIAGLEGARIQVVGGDTAAEVKTYVIPKIENTYKSGVGPKKFTPSYKPPSSDANVENADDRFVQAVSTVPTITEYGLQLRREKPGNDAGDAGPSNGAGDSTTTAALESRAFREAVEELPDAVDVEAYEAMPVEEFGKAMLRGMGWQEGMGVGRNRRKVDAIEYVRRPERLGLGAQPVALAPDTSKPLKMGEKPQRQDLVLAPDADGRQRNIRKLDEQLVARSTVLPGPQPGKAMRITRGPHAGLACTALNALPRGAQGKPERWRVRLTASQEEVNVLATDLGEKWDRDKERYKHKDEEREEEKQGSGRRSTERDAERGGGGGGGGGESRGRAHGDEPDRGGSGNGRREGSAAAAAAAAAAAGGEPSSRRGDGRDADDRRLAAGREYDRQYDRDRDGYRHRDRDERDDGGGGTGGGGKRKHRENDEQERRALPEDDGRGGKKSRGSIRGHDRHDEEDHHDARDDAKGGHSRHRLEKKDKKEKKEKKEKKIKDRSKGREREDGKRSRGRGSSGDSDTEDDVAAGAGAREPQRSAPTWLFPSIKVRIVDKSVRGGKLYLKKGTVVDVHPGAAADVAVDDTGDVLRLTESSLETVVPRHEGAPVLVVAGRHRGARGRLLQASTSTGAAAVQLATDFSIVRLLLDDVAGFAGELDDD